MTLPSRPVLVTNALGVEPSVPSLHRLLRYADQATPRSLRGVTGGQHAVPVYVPYEDTLALAVQLSREGALGVAEAAGFRVGGWARAVGALDLTTRQVSERFAADIAGQLDRVIFYGNNGWTRGFGADQTLRILIEPGAGRLRWPASGRRGRAAGREVDGLVAPTDRIARGWIWRHRRTRQNVA